MDSSLFWETLRDSRRVNLPMEEGRPFRLFLNRLSSTSLVANWRSMGRSARRLLDKSRLTRCSSLKMFPDNLESLLLAKLMRVRPVSWAMRSSTSLVKLPDLVLVEKEFGERHG